VAGVASCSKNETCHAEGSHCLKAKKRHSVVMNQMVSSRFRYISGQGGAHFPARSLSGRLRNTISLLSSTEV
jgi:hypothetical protein